MENQTPNTKGVNWTTLAWVIAVCVSVLSLCFAIFSWFVREDYQAAKDALEQRQLLAVEMLSLAQDREKSATEYAKSLKAELDSFAHLHRDFRSQIQALQKDTAQLKFELRRKLENLLARSKESEAKAKEQAEVLKETSGLSWRTRSWPGGIPPY